MTLNSADSVAGRYVQCIELDEPTEGVALCIHEIRRELIPYERGVRRPQRCEEQEEARQHWDQPSSELGR